MTYQPFMNEIKLNIETVMNSSLTPKEINDKKSDLDKFVKYIAESSILIYDDGFNHTLVPFKDIDFRYYHPLKSKYVFIVIHYNDDDGFDTLFNLFGSLKTVIGAVTVGKSASDSSHKGCGLSGTNCLTPRLAIKCFQLLNTELSTIMSPYKPVGNITTVSLDGNKGIMTQQYEKISESSILRKKSSKLKKKNSLNQRFPGEGRRSSNNISNAQWQPKTKNNKKSVRNARIAAMQQSDRAVDSLVSRKNPYRSNSGKGESLNF
jgi:hypothetical protein